MKTIKRIFLIAGYDKNGKINSALVHQVKSFAKYGDCVLVMDSDCDESEIAKIKPYCLTKCYIILIATIYQTMILCIW